MPPERSIAYFSMEIAVDAALPTYSGGLGVLAGDTLRAAADAGLPLVALTLVHRKGYLRQRFDQSGWQHSDPEDWAVEKWLTEMPVRAHVQLEDRVVVLRAWRHEIAGATQGKVPVFFLDSDLPENTAWDRTLTHFLYGGDAYYRLCQEIILGIGGLRMLRALGYDRLKRFHMNEGHSSLLTLELLVEEAHRAQRTVITDSDIQAVRASCIFTTHTPVTAGHDQFPMDLVGRVLRGNHDFFAVADAPGIAVFDQILQLPPGMSPPANVFRPDIILNLTYLALNLSHYVNGVAKRHAEVSRLLFAKYRIDEITNGVHAATWAAPALGTLYDRYMPGWAADNFSLRYALNIPRDELWAAHLEAKRQLLAAVFAATGLGFSPEVLTLGFARRFTAYKRADLVLSNLPQLRAVADKSGPLQLIFSGKAHPQDQGGKEIIQHILRIKDQLPPNVRLAYLPNYDLALARLLVAGCDVWLNTPLPPLEASGTSGMKAALNGVPSLSILDGWWLEGCIEHVTGWAIGERPAEPAPGHERTQEDATRLYEKLGDVVAPCYYQQRDRFMDIMRHAIALNGSFFNTQRMIQQYVLKAYL